MTISNLSNTELNGPTTCHFAHRLRKTTACPGMYLIVGGRSQEKQSRVLADHISEPTRPERDTVMPMNKIYIVLNVSSTSLWRFQACLLAPCLGRHAIDISHLPIHGPLSTFSFNKIIEVSLPNCWGSPLILINLVLTNINEKPRITRHLNKSSITGEKQNKDEQITTGFWRKEINPATRRGFVKIWISILYP